VTVISRGVFHVRNHTEESCVGAWFSRSLLACRLPRRPLPYAFAASLIIHLAVAAIVFELRRHPASFDVAAGHGGENCVFVGTIQLDEKGSTSSDAVVPEVNSEKPPVKTIAPSTAIVPQDPLTQITKFEPRPTSPTAASLTSIQAQPTDVPGGSPSTRSPSAGQITEGEVQPDRGRSGRGMFASVHADGDLGIAKAPVLAKPDYLHNPPPKYPGMARERGWQGITVLRVLVLSDGSAGRVELVHTSGHRVLDDSSMRTVRGWKFRPARLGDRAVDSLVEIPIRFQLVGS